MLYHYITFETCTFFEIFISNLLVTINKKVPKKFKKKYISPKKSHFSWFFHFFPYGLGSKFTIFAITIYHKKMWKKVVKKNTKKNGIFFFKTLFYFSKMDKNNCPKKFLKKKFQKTGIFCFFFSFIVFIKIIKTSPKIAILVLNPRNSHFCMV
jgi:hypothetical protein